MGIRLGRNVFRRRNAMSASMQHVIVGLATITLILLSINFLSYDVYSHDSHPRAPPARAFFSEFDETECGFVSKRERDASLWKNRCPQSGIVTTMRVGRLGNQIWEYATVFALSKKTGLEPFVQTCHFEYLKEHFEKLSVPPLKDIARCTFDKSRVVDSLERWNSIEDNIRLPRYTFDWSVIWERYDEVRREMKFNAELLSHATTVLKMAANRHKMSDVTFVGVHVRRGDYGHWLRKRHNAALAPVTFFHKAMDYYEKKYDNVLFVVSSDSVDWCLKHLPRDRSKIELISDSSSKGPVRDLAVLSTCNHSIIDYGTYGAWAALTAAGETIVYNLTGHLTTGLSRLIPNWQIME